MSKLPAMAFPPPVINRSGMVMFIEQLLTRSDEEIESIFMEMPGSRKDGLPPTGKNLRAFLECKRDELRMDIN